MPPHILILYNQPVLPNWDPESDAERAVFETVLAVREHLGQAGFEVKCKAVSRDLRAFVADIASRPPDGIFNLFEGYGDDPASEARVAGWLEAHVIPITGCSSRVLRLAGAKHLAKAALAAAGLPTPKSTIVVRAPCNSRGLEWPVIAKPALYHGSIGIEQASVATTPAQLAARVDYLLGRYRGPVLVEEFIVGREFTVGVIEARRLTALPAMEFEFIDPSQASWPLVSYDAKWRPESSAYRCTPARHAARLTPRLERQLSDLARSAFRTLRCRDYARVDFRLDAQGRPWILEVNPNPDLSPTACLAGALAAAGFDYGRFLVGLTRAALSRGRTVVVPSN